MSRDRLLAVVSISAVVLFVVSWFVAMAYAGPEPFTEYRRSDALFHIGISSAVIAFWMAWSLGIVTLIAAGAFRLWWLGGLLLAAVCIFYLIQSPLGYLDDMEMFMLPRQ